jgi:Bardet-Biedl syndrome 4 protein
LIVESLFAKMSITALGAQSTVRERRNWWIHTLYTRGEYDEALRVIEEVLRASNGLAEYPLYVKGLIRRQQGQIAESLTLFQAATCLNPLSASNLKQVAKSLFLLGRHAAAIEVYAEADNVSLRTTMRSAGDWESLHAKGSCHMHLKQFAEAEECFKGALALTKHDATYISLGKLYTLQEKYRQALETYREALDFSPENTELLTTTGLLYLRVGETTRAFEYLRSSLDLDPRNPKTILAAGSIIQDHNDTDMALLKYRVAAVQTPYNAQLWSNIGMCFFSKKKLVAAIACLKRALYLDPFEWIVAYNLGLLHLNTGQYASAFHYLSASLNLKPNYSSGFMYLGITLAKLNDINNSCAAYEKALAIEPDFLIHLNYAASTYNASQSYSKLAASGGGNAASAAEAADKFLGRSKEQFSKFGERWKMLPVEARAADPDVVAMAKNLSTVLGMPFE